MGSFANVEKRHEDIFRIAKQMKKVNKDVVGVCCIRDNRDNLTLSTEAKPVVLGK